MSTLDVLNAISEAREALIRVPELESTIKSITEERDFIKLERDEAELTISRLKARIADLEAICNGNDQIIRSQADRINELTDRNANLDDSVTNLLKQVEDARAIREEQSATIVKLQTDVRDLAEQLRTEKTSTAALTNVLRNIGQSIVKAVEVPEVTSEKPFPVSDTVGLPDPSSFGMVGERKLMVDPIMAEPGVVSPEQERNSFNSEPKSSPGCYTYPW